jgi:methyl-accepting chemotaxis protein
MTPDLKPNSPPDSVSQERNGHSPEVKAMPEPGASNGSANSTEPKLPYRGKSIQGSPRYAPKNLVVTHKSSFPLARWFNNLSVRNKQLLGLITSEMISVLGLVGVGSLLMISAGRAQLAQQSKAELEVVEIKYNIKINQMGFGFRGQSDNAAIIRVAENNAVNYAPSLRQIEQVRGILQNEVQARNIEYATLIGRDGKIIVGANADRTGETLDPYGLVSRVLKDPQQIKVSEQVTWEELQKENPPLPDGFSGEDALIRYTVTPVFGADNPDQVVGVLLSGDIVNQKLPIVEETLEVFGTGYSGIYSYREQDDSFALATSVDRETKGADLETNAPLASLNILQRAVKANEGETVVRRIREPGGNTYTVSARAIRDLNGDPMAVLVRGTSETALNALIGNSLKWQFGIATLAILSDILIARLLGRSVVNPLRRLQRATESFAAGDRRARAEVYARDEVGQVASAFNELASTLTASEVALRSQADTETRSAQRANLLAELTSRIRQTLDADEILSTSVDSVREVMAADRVVIYRFDRDLKSGTLTAESVGRGWARAKGQSIEDPLTPEAIERFRTGKVSWINDLNSARLSHCHCDILERLEVKANLVAPILVGEDLIGLICVHQCGNPRQWLQEEIDFIQQIATQIGYALGQALLLAQQKRSTERQQQLTLLVTQMRESLERDKIFRTVAQGARLAINTDRVLVFMFDPQWQGTIVAESVDGNWPTALGSQISDPCFAERYVEQYRQGRVQATDNIATAGLTECHLKQLKPMQVQANLVAPIVVREQLLGLLIAHECKGPRNWDPIDINFLKQVAGQLGFALEQADLFRQQELANQRERQLNELVTQIRRPDQPEGVMHAAVNQFRYVLNTDRVVIYRFLDDWTGTVVAESVGDPTQKILGATVNDPMREGLIERYRNGRVRVMNDIYAENLTKCHQDILEGFSIRACLVAPIIQNGQLTDILCVHQCDGPRQWSPDEVDLTTQFAIQLGFALEQVNLFSQREKARQDAESLSEERRQRQEALQMQLLNLLSDVEGAAQGDLTVRADVTAGEIGTVADFFNSIVENLRQIVTQVKDSATQVNLALGANENAIRTLAVEASQQAEKTTQTLSSVEVMTQSISQVAFQAQQAATVAKSASDTANMGGEAMDLTVQNIINLRETVGETAKKVKRLGESSQQISKVVSLINQIAMQTNLLAINAGIEAARAGQEGQGFAAVAEEVGELAARSAAATQEIERIVETIQRETSDVVAAIEQNTSQVVESTRRVETAKMSLSQMVQVSRQIDELMQTISGATASQVATAEQVASLMQQIAEVSNRTSTSSLQVSEALKQTVDVAQTLQDSMATFKVDG